MVDSKTYAKPVSKFLKIIIFLLNALISDIWKRSRSVGLGVREIPYTDLSSLYISRELDNKNVAIVLEVRFTQGNKGGG